MRRPSFTAAARGSTAIRRSRCSRRNCKTGRTHQIRVHLTHLGFPLAGDDKYGDFAWNKVLAKQGLKRMFLHSYSLGFVHPVTGDAMAFESPLPDDLARFVARLNSEAMETRDA